MVRLVLLAETSETVSKAVNLLGPQVIGYHPIEGWIVVPRILAEAAIATLNRYGILAEIRELPPS